MTSAADKNEECQLMGSKVWGREHGLYHGWAVNYNADLLDYLPEKQTSWTYADTHRPGAGQVDSYIIVLRTIGSEGARLVLPI